ncbi:MAG: single-stranded-DNA-specific exonuclease RecJ [Acidobacteria bacterium]|nr:single-stranded-DNA-specific exonuclease RecJ [Acidobacteriota bacterium]
MLFDRWTLHRGETGGLELRSKLLRSAAHRRGIVGAGDARVYFSPELSDLHDARLIHGMDGACMRIERAIEAGEPILIYGDYDVDGVTSIVLLRAVIHRLRGKVGYVIPHRLIHGYGLKTEVIESVLRDKAIGLVITVDCGISSVEPVQRALERGIDVIVTDHHLPPGILPDAVALLNPKIDGCAYPYPDLAGAGVAFKLGCELLRRAGNSMPIESLLKIAAIGTIADVAPLSGENRVIAKLGLEGLESTTNRGLRALFAECGIRPGSAPKASDIGFRIGPRINAAGRLASADTAIELFSARTDDEARLLAKELSRLNSERQETEKELLTAADAMIETKGPIPAAIVLASEGWHRGVVGLCAGRIAQKHNRPTLVIAIGDGRAVGSGRSIAPIDLHAAMQKHEELFEHFGGHSHACGFSMRPELVPELERRLVSDLGSLPPETFMREALVDGELDLSELDAALIDALERFEPFGAANPRITALVRDVEILSTREFASDCYEVMLRQGKTVARAVLWRSASLLKVLLSRGARVDVLAHPEMDTYWKAPRLEIVDMAHVGKFDI